MKKKNCWEYKNCGRELNGHNAKDGICPATVESRLHGVHDGRRAGRACWVVAGTKCGGVVQGTFANKYGNCEKCDFYKLVQQEEGLKFRMSTMLLKMLKEG